MRRDGSTPFLLRLATDDLKTFEFFGLGLSKTNLPAGRQVSFPAPQNKNYTLYDLRVRFRFMNLLMVAAFKEYHTILPDVNWYFSVNTELTPHPPALLHKEKDLASGETIKQEALR